MAMLSGLGMLGAPEARAVVPSVTATTSTLKVLIWRRLAAVEDEARHPGRHDHQRLGYLLEARENEPGRHGDGDGRDVHERAPAKHERGAGDRAGGRGRHPVDERLHAAIPREPAEV